MAAAIKHKAKKGLRKCRFGQHKSVWTTRTAATTSFSLACALFQQNSNCIDISKKTTPRHLQCQPSDSDSDEWLDISISNDQDIYVEDFAANDCSSNLSMEIVREGMLSPEFQQSFDDSFDISSYVEEDKKVSTLHEMSRDIRDMMPSFSLSAITDSSFSCQTDPARPCIEQSSVATQLLSVSFSSRRFNVMKSLEDEMLTVHMRPALTFPNTSCYEEIPCINDANCDDELPAGSNIEDTVLNTVIEMQMVDDLNETRTAPLVPLRTSTPIIDRRNNDINPFCNSVLPPTNDSPKRVTLTSSQNSSIEEPVNSTVKQNPGKKEPFCNSILPPTNDSPKRVTLTSSQNSNVEEPINSTLKRENIFLFVPNIIGYARIVLALISFYYMPFDHIKATICYLLSGLLDAFDGYAARWLNQATKFGAMLDQLTDRCATMCLLVTLSYFYPAYMFLFQISMTVDIASHWIHLQTSLMQGKTSHKFIDASENPLMKIYYTSRPLLFTMCAGNELFYSMLYLLYFTEGPVVLGIGIFRLCALICAPISFAKSVISLLQMGIACMNLGIIDVNERIALSDKKK